ncbi:ABATE domain-containing protein [Streptomyces sp. H10-C2]|uniref:CGNR zinc finger domain-containing protein n=1 Tax=unclassified Streptomyces TaxID=2593676 RepID=UPI0024B9B2F7|nr:MULTISPECIES: ABATE domain-containing protein [unclassified Streptomyces]MDJ0344363.1 ABATE domain-containing protein [Streptomyces sp. PH10-H1]MDJ0373732.1 ABATE domain-containing protein [Streptomyces sp. H10-C2]
MTVSASSELRFDTGRVCLNLLATVTGRLPDEPVDRLDSPARLTEWLYGSGLVPSGTPVPADAAWLGRFLALRDVLRRVVTAQLGATRDGAAPADISRLNAAALAAPPAPSARPAPDGSLVRTLAAEPDCAALLAAVARDAVDLLTDPAARSQLRQCEGESCSLIYLDASRGRRRRWCSSEICGNRERVARHRRRAVATQP